MYLMLPYLPPDATISGTKLSRPTLSKLVQSVLTLSASKFKKKPTIYVLKKMHCMKSQLLHEQTQR
jgi:hypothetical protein